MHLTSSFTTRRLKRAVLAVAAAQLGFELSGEPPPNSDVSPYLLTIMTWNVQFLPGLPAQSAKAMGELAAKEKPHYLGITEGFSGRAMDKFREGAESYLQLVARERPPAGRTKIVNGGLGSFTGQGFTAKVIAEKKWPTCAYRGEFDCPAAKGVLLTRVETKEKRQVNVFTVHLNAGQTDESRRARKEQLVELKGFVKEYALVPKLPTFIIGDFNIRGPCMGCDACFEDVEEKNEFDRDWLSLLHVDGLGAPVDTFRENCGDDPSICPGRTMREYCWRIDYILHYPFGITYEKHSYKTGEMDRRSDHYAVSARFMISE